jgi:hypothetical protein
MKKLLTLALLCACLSADARRVRVGSTLITSCPCDHTQVVDWGDGTHRFVLEVGGTGYEPNTVVRVEWSDVQGCPLWSFDCLTYDDGSFSEIWTDVPPGSYTIQASQSQNKNRFTVLAMAEVEVL